MRSYDPPMLRCPSDDSFGPVLGPGTACASFDFTLLFEEAFFTTIPCAIILLLIALSFSSIWRRPPVVEWPLMGSVKTVLTPQKSYIWLLLLTHQLPAPLLDHRSPSDKPARTLGISYYGPYSVHSGVKRASRSINLCSGRILHVRALT